jgi:predicted CoA-binding protein
MYFILVSLRKKKKRQREELEALERARQMIEARLTVLWTQDMERQEKMMRKAHRLAKKRKAYYVT